MRSVCPRCKEPIIRERRLGVWTLRSKILVCADGHWTAVCATHECGTEVDVTKHIAAVTDLRTLQAIAIRA